MHGTYSTCPYSVVEDGHLLRQHGVVLGKNLIVDCFRLSCGCGAACEGMGRG